MQSSKGLSAQEAQERLARYGPNQVAARETVRFWSIFLEEIVEPMMLLLLAVTVLYFLVGDRNEAFVVLAIVIALTMIEVWTEFRAKRTISALGVLSEPSTRVIRDGGLTEVPVEQVVPGDLLFLTSGCRVAADGALIRADELAVDESSLTGESTPAEKQIPGAEPEPGTGDRSTQVFRGSLVTRGEGVAEVTATGRETELGRVVALAERTKPPKTPLQVFMKEISKKLAVAAIVLSILVPVVFMVVSRLPWQQGVLTGLSMAFAVIPEELPILVTIALGLGSFRLVRKNALVRELRAAETLGHLSAVVTDKTGTLTENRLKVAKWLPGETLEPVEVPAIPHDAPAGVIAAFLSLGAQEADVPLVDPIERAMSEAFSGFRTEIAPFEKPQRIPFLRERGWSGASWSVKGPAGPRRVFIKGSPEAILDRAATVLSSDGASNPLDESRRNAALAVVDDLAAGGYRVLAVAQSSLSGDGLPESWTFVGLLALEDPVRPEAREAIETVRRAGVDVYIATGDHPAIARAVAERIGLPSERILTGPELDKMPGQELEQALKSTFLFARILPEHKLRMVQALQRSGHTVGMIGDGINDAPALKAASVGIAMGRGGTDAAREASSLVLTDDRFATLASGIRDGRGLFANIQKAVRYYLAIKLALVAIMLIPSILGFTPPFSPLMIILLELFMDLAASSAFVVEPAESALMSLPPRSPSVPLLDRDLYRGIAGGSLLLSVVVLASAFLARSLALPQDAAASFRTAAFAAWMVGHIVLAYRFRTWMDPLRSVGFFSNGVLNLWAVCAIATTMSIVYIPPLRSTLGTVPLSWLNWGIIAGLAFLVIGVGALLVRVRAPKSDASVSV